MAIYKARAGLETVEEYEVEQVSADIVVNANESNWGLPEEVKALVLEAAQSFRFNRYPPMRAESLCRIIAADLGIEADNLQVGNGSSELLQMACYAFGGSGRKIAFPYPSFSMYGVYVKLADAQAAPYQLTPEGYIDAKAVIEFCAKEQPALLIVCNPNNPTGNYNPLKDMEQILANVDCPVLMDEAYMEFARGEGVDVHDLRPLKTLKTIAGSTLALTGKYTNFLCLRTFSKAYGLAGMRVGYAIGGRALLRVLGKVLLPYHINGFSLLCAQTVYAHKNLYEERISLIIEEREKMSQALLDLGFKVWPSRTNFLLFKAEKDLAVQLTKYCLGEKYIYKTDSDEVLSGCLIYQYLLENKILVRDFSGHAALPGCIRLTLGTPEENFIILQNLKTLCVKAGGI